MVGGGDGWGTAGACPATPATPRWWPLAETARTKTEMKMVREETTRVVDVDIGAPGGGDGDCGCGLKIGRSHNRRAA